MLLRPRSWGSAKPPMGSQIDWGHPLAQGLELCVVGSEQGGTPTDLVANRRFAVGGGSPGWNARNGGSMKLASATSDRYSLAMPDEPFLRTTGISTLWAGILDTGGIFHAFATKGGERPLDFRSGNGTPPNVAFNRGSGVAAARFNSTGTLSLGDPHQIIVTAFADLSFNASDTKPRLWIDGHEDVMTQTSLGTAGQLADGTGADLLIGRRNDGAVQIDGCTTRFYLWSRRLQPHEAAWLQAEPYAFILTPKVWSIQTPSADATASPAAVLITLTEPTPGQNATALPAAPLVTLTEPTPNVVASNTAHPSAVVVTTHISDFSATALPEAVVVGVVSVPVAPTVVSPFHEEADLRFDVIDLSDMSSIIVSLDNRVSGAWQDILSDAGTGELVLLNDDPAVADMVFPNRLINCYYLGVLAFTLLPGAAERVLFIQGEESEHRTRYICEGHAALTNRGVVYPTLGVGREPIEEDRGFNWTSPVFDDSTWTAPTVVCTVGDAKASWSILWNPEYADDTASILWDTYATPTEAVPGTIYFRQEFIVSVSAMYTLDAQADNYAEFYLDGQLIMSPGQSSGNFGNAFLTLNRAVVRVTAGVHVMAVRCVGIAFPEPAIPGAGPGTQLSNPAGESWSLHLNDSSTSDLGTMVAHSDSSAVMLARPATTPGMTPGQVLLIVIAEAQARGDLPYLTVSFTATHDSGGLAWPVVADIATKVGTKLFVFLRELSATYIDFRMRPGATILDAYVFGTMGGLVDVDYHAPTDPNDESTGNLTEHHETEEA